MEEHGRRRKYAEKGDSLDEEVGERGERVETTAGGEGGEDTGTAEDHQETECEGLEDTESEGKGLEQAPGRSGPAVDCLDDEGTGTGRGRDYGRATNRRQPGREGG